jgi:hypothetical protein
MCLLINLLAWWLSLAGFTDTSIRHNDAGTTLTVIAEVKIIHEKYAILYIEEIVTYGKDVKTSVSTGQEISVTNPGKLHPRIHTKVMVNLKEKKSAGAFPCTLMLLSYTSIQNL